MLLVLISFKSKRSSETRRIIID